MAVRVEVMLAAPSTLRAPATATGMHDLLGRLVSEGAALGWVDPPSIGEITAILDHLAEEVGTGDASMALAMHGDRVVGAGWWRRYSRPTHSPHADLERLGVQPTAQGDGIGQALLAELVRSAEDAGIEVLTLDHRGDHDVAHRLYERAGFEEYGRLRDFVAVGGRRWDKVLMALDLRQDCVVG
jgi:ribosomal protein S18 acetylase RimI-like enzyme